MSFWARMNGLIPSKLPPPPFSMTPRIGLLLFTALLMQCENPVETPGAR